MESRSVTCQLTLVNVARLDPAKQAGTRFTYPEGSKAELTSVVGYIPRWYTYQLITGPNVEQCR